MTRRRHVIWHLARSLACGLPLAAAAIAEETPLAMPTTPAGTQRGWIEPSPARAEATPSSSPPATLRLPTGSPATPLGTSLPDLPAAAEFDQRLIAAFTTNIQPLLINRCGSGRCHGGPDTRGPRFSRRGPGGAVDRDLTLANIDALCKTLRSDPDPSRLLVPAATPHGGGTQTPLTRDQLERLAAWVDAALAQRKRWGTATVAGFEEAVVTPDSAAAAAGVRPAPAAASDDNRFRRLLERAAAPQRLPPPQEPSGVIDFERFPEAGPPAD